MISEKSEDLEVNIKLLGFIRTSSIIYPHNVKVVKLLLERGCNVDAATYTGITPLQVYTKQKLSTMLMKSIVMFTGGFEEGLYLSGEVAAWLGCCSGQGVENLHWKLQIFA